MKSRRYFIPALLLAAATPALAWDAHGHRMVTLLALDACIGVDKPEGGAGQAGGLPLWLTEPKIRAAIAYQSGEPDRIRGQTVPQLTQVANTDHYMDVEMLADWDLSLETLPPLRYQFVKAMVLSREKHPERFASYEPEKDKFNEHEWPGFVPYAAMESYGQLQASFKTVKIIEALGVSGREAQLDQAQQNVIYWMGQLSHFVGDIAQPLHTTIHHHGWVGPPEKNPNRYTTDTGIHSWIDGGALATLRMDYEGLASSPVKAVAINIDDPWKDVLAEIARSFAKVEPLYQLHKDGKFSQPEGKAFLEERIRDGAATLAALYRAAWLTSDPSKQDIDYFKYGTPAEGTPSLPPVPKKLPPAKDADEAAKRNADAAVRKAANDAAKKKVEEAKPQ